MQLQISKIWNLIKHLILVCFVIFLIVFNCFVVLVGLMFLGLSNVFKYVYDVVMKYIDISDDWMVTLDRK